MSSPSFLLKSNLKKLIKKIDVGTLCSKKWDVRKEKSSTSIIYSQNFDQNGFIWLLF